METGGSNIQFAVNPADGRMVVIEMNPRVSRSSALASKATGFPIAKIAALLAVGYTLDEITNDITGETPACFEPALDYVVVKIPRWAFEKFPAGRPDARHQDEVGRRGHGGRPDVQGGLRQGASGRWSGRRSRWARTVSRTLRRTFSRALATPTEERLSLVELALARGHSVDDVAASSRIDPWFVDQIAQVVEEAGRIEGRP